MLPLQIPGLQEEPLQVLSSCLLLILYTTGIVLHVLLHEVSTKETQERSFACAPASLSAVLLCSSSMHPCPVHAAAPHSCINFFFVFCVC